MLFLTSFRWRFSYSAATAALLLCLGTFVNRREREIIARSLLQLQLPSPPFPAPLPKHNRLPGRARAHIDPPLLTLAALSASPVTPFRDRGYACGADFTGKEVKFFRGSKLQLVDTLLSTSSPPPPRFVLATLFFFRRPGRVQLPLRLFARIGYVDSAAGGAVDAQSDGLGSRRGVARVGEGVVWARACVGLSGFLDGGLWGCVWGEGLGGG